LAAHLVVDGQGGNTSGFEPRVPERTSTYTIRQQYCAVKHDSFFTEPADVRIGVDSNLPRIRSTAFLSPDGNRWVGVAPRRRRAEDRQTRHGRVRAYLEQRRALGASMPVDSVVTAVFEK
jgi:hypothetical protein